MESSLPSLDNLKIAENKDIVSQLDGETLVFSGKVKKFNPYDWLQERTLVITNHAIYNFNGKSLQRKIFVKNLKGVTKSTATEAGEFVMHCQSEYDYRMKAEPNRDEIIGIIKKVFHSLKKMNLPIYGVKPAKLGDFATSKKDVAKGMSRIPLDLARIKAEDIFSESATGAVETVSTDKTESEFENINERDGGHFIPNMDVNQDIFGQTRGKSNTIFSKRKDDSA
jgi:hypothetical protein